MTSSPMSRVQAWSTRGIIDFVQDAVAEREPHPAVQIERRTNAALGAGSPARRNSRPAGGKAFSSFSLNAEVPIP